MLFRLACLSALLAYCNAMNGDIPASSNLGSKILSKSRRLNADEDLVWVTDYDLKFHKCYNIAQFAEEGNGGDEGGAPIEYLNMVHYKLCPSNKCTTGKSSCSGGGDYVVRMEEFLEAFMENKEEQQQYNCELAEQACGCGDNDGDDEDQCRANCYAAAGLDYCGEDDDNNGNQFEVNEYLECEQADFGYNDDTPLFMGAYCAQSGNEIRLGVFADEQCSELIGSQWYSDNNYGSELPYSSESIVHRRCISCLAREEIRDDDNNNNDDADPEVREICEQNYEEAGKCETYVEGVYYKDEYSCEFIHQTLPAMAKATSNYSGSRGGGVSAKAYAWLFFITTIGLGGLVFHLHTKIMRSSVGLADQDQSGTSAMA